MFSSCFLISDLPCHFDVVNFFKESIKFHHATLAFPLVTFPDWLGLDLVCKDSLLDNLHENYFKKSQN